MQSLPLDAAGRHTARLPPRPGALPDGQRDTGELLNLLADWAPNETDRRSILVDGPNALFFAD